MGRVLAASLLLASIAAVPATAAELDFEGSLGDGRHSRYVPPLSNPLLNETPYITTELRPIYLYNRIPGDFLTQGGRIRIVAAELRVALTERLGFIASKDGYADLEFDAVLPDETGFVNISAGLKYALISRPEDETILTVGAEYEPPTGNVKTGGISLQGDGDGILDLFVTGATTFGKLGLQGSVGANLALDGDHDSSQLHYSLHADYEALPRFFPLVELNGFTTIDDGDRTAADFEGIDLVNFGSTDSGTVITGAVGARYRFTDNIQMGLGYETPLTDREDIMDWRVYVDLVFSL